MATGGSKTAPYGSWRSPVSAALIAAGSIRLGDLVVDGGDVFWVEVRPAEGGRSVIVRRAADGGVGDLLPAPFSARTRVHEYGGGAFTVAGGVVYFANADDQRLYRLALVDGAGSAAQPISPEGAYRYADLAVDRTRHRLVCVREDHTGAGREPTNTLVSVAVEAPAPPRVLATGSDFYSSPRLSPNASRLAWLSWDHPNMPWDGTELWMADVAPDGSLGAAELVAGSTDEAIVQPEWSPDGILHFVSDRSGWWNLYARHDDGIRPLCAMEVDVAHPHWIFGVSAYAFTGPEEIVSTYVRQGRWSLGVLDTRLGTLRTLDLPYTQLATVRALPTHPPDAHAGPASPSSQRSTAAVAIAASPDMAPAVVLIDVAGSAGTIVRSSSILRVDPAHWSHPEPISFPTTGGESAHAFYYPPRHPDFAAPQTERPPLLVMSHGGPTAATSTGLNPRVQFWTTRGFAVVDVDYRGSTGYGRAYRRLLDGRWGVADVEDCIAAARFLMATDRADPARLAITGSSAGGFTTLCALTFHDVFHAGASYYGISDLEALAADTHKFESRYHERLVGPYPGERDLYRARSPIHFADRLARPVIFFQGSDDRVVPPNQAERMVDALRARGLPVALIVFEGESHGFRRAETIERALEAELDFYARVFGIRLAQI